MQNLSAGCVWRENDSQQRPAIAVDSNGLISSDFDLERVTQGTAITRGTQRRAVIIGMRGFHDRAVFWHHQRTDAGLEHERSEEQKQ